MTLYRMGKPVTKGKAKGRSTKPPRKKLRLAPQRDRDIAAGLVALYRKNKGTGWICYSDDGKAEHATMDGDFLAARLDEFAETGTFVITPARQAKRRDHQVRARFTELYPAVVGYEEAVAKCAELFRCSESTVRAAVGRKTATKMGAHS